LEGSGEEGVMEEIESIRIPEGRGGRGARSERTAGWRPCAYAQGQGRQQRVETGSTAPGIKKLQKKDNTSLIQPEVLGGKFRGKR